MHIDELTRVVIGVAMRIHTALGPGLFETVYEAVLAGKLLEEGLNVDRQLPVDIDFEGKRYGSALKIDLLIEKRLIIEVKSTGRDNPLFAQQALTYLRLTGLEVGLVLNFGAASLRNGIKRVVNDYKPSATSAPSCVNQQRQQ